MSLKDADEELRKLQSVWRSVTRNWNRVGKSGRAWLKENFKELPIDRDLTDEEMGMKKKAETDD